MRLFLHEQHDGHVDPTGAPEITKGLCFGSCCLFFLLFHGLFSNGLLVWWSFFFFLYRGVVNVLSFYFVYIPSPLKLVKLKFCKRLVLDITLPYPKILIVTPVYNVLKYFRFLREINERGLCLLTGVPTEEDMVARVMYLYLFLRRILS